MQDGTVIDDILMVLDLPLAAVELREAGVEEAEISEAIDGAAELGVSAGVATEVIVAETAEVKGRGKKKGFGIYVKKLLLEGYRGKELAAKIRECTYSFRYPPEMQKGFQGADRWLPIDYKKDWELVRRVAQESGQSFTRAAFEKEKARQEAKGK